MWVGTMTLTSVVVGASPSQPFPVLGEKFGPGRIAGVRCDTLAAGSCRQNVARATMEFSAPLKTGLDSLSTKGSSAFSRLNGPRKWRAEVPER